MKAAVANQTFVTIEVSIESEQELDIVLRALHMYADTETARGKATGRGEFTNLGDRAAAMRVQIAEAAGL